MTRSTISFSLLVTLCAFIVSCNADDYKVETDSKHDSHDPSQRMMSDTAHMMTEKPGTMPDHGGMQHGDTSAAATMHKTDPASAKSRKGKISSVMMTSSNKSLPRSQDKQGFYSSVEVLPMFPGGQKALDNFVSKNLEYPEDAMDNGIEGMVTVNFAVDEAGKISNAKIVGKPIGHGLEDAVLSALSKMPTWTPGVIKGKNVKTYYTLPVNFKLDQ